MVLIASLSWRISPRTSTVILRESSPLATAVATSAMLRTWPVRLLAIELTESVKSFHVPATPGTCAWPPSFPSVPTSRATRVRSDVPNLAGKVTGHRVNGVRQIFPRAGNAGHLRLAAQFSIGSDFASYSRHFCGEDAELLNHGIDDVGGA